MSPKQFEDLLNKLKELGPDANIAVFAYSDESKNMVIQLPNEKGDSYTQIASKLAKIFSTVLCTAEKQEDKRMYTIIRDAVAAAILPYINGLTEEELIGLALLGQ